MAKTLTQYIEQHGDDWCSQQWGIKPRTVAAYRRRERFPTRKKALRLVALSGGELTLDAIFSVDKPDQQVGHQ